jgi:predicted DNA-binding transcriptional regulator YafY
MRDEAGRMSARFHMDSVDWYREADDVRHLPALARAVLDQRPVTMSYESWRTTGDWTVEPLGLVLKAGGWYLVATGGGKIRMFNVAMIRTLSAGEGRFERPEGFDLPGWWTAELARFEAELRPETATIRATPLGLKRLAGLGAFAAKAVRAAEGEIVRLPIETSDHGVLALLGCGPEIEVLAPAELRARLKSLAEAIAARAA